MNGLVSTVDQESSGGAKAVTLADRLDTQEAHHVEQLEKVRRLKELLNLNPELREALSLLQQLGSIQHY